MTDLVQIRTRSLPKEKIFFTSNAILAEKPAIPWLLEGNHDLALETMRRMKGFLPGDTVIVPGHGRPTTIEASLDYFIAYLRNPRSGGAGGRGQWIVIGGDRQGRHG